MSVNYHENPACINWVKNNLSEEIGEIHWQLTVPELVEHAIKNNEGVLSDKGALVCKTGKFTGRSPKDKFIVEDEKTKDNVWWGTVNHPLSPENFDALYKKMVAYLKGKRIYIRDAYASASANYTLPLRSITMDAWQNLFINNLFLRPTAEQLTAFTPGFTILQIPNFEANPTSDGTKNKNFTIINFTKKIILIGGTGYAGEIKKAVFTVLNYLLPLEHDVLPMHCAATTDAKGQHTAIYFGLSGTGKTTLSADPDRFLIGDDEHGWEKEAIFNFEGGCYAKTVHLSHQYEPLIFQAIKFGTVVENMCFIKQTRVLDYVNDSITENMRAAYPLDYITNACFPSHASLPDHIFLLTCDAYGVLPPISKLDKAQAIYYFLSGYTAKIAGTEDGVREPETVFSPCFGGPFLPLHPIVYTKLFFLKIQETNPCIWLLNTGWIGGSYGVGKRISISHSRAIVKAILANALQKVNFCKDVIFGLNIPEECPGVPKNILNPSQVWQDVESYKTMAIKLEKEIACNMNQFKEKLHEEGLPVM